MKIEYLDENLIKKTLINFFKNNNVYIKVTLITGDLLFGRFDFDREFLSDNFVFGRFHPNNNYSDTSIFNDLWIPEYDEELNGFRTYKIQPLYLYYGSIQLEIPYHIIADLTMLGWDQTTNPFKYHGDFDNPLSKLIFEHNNKVSIKNNLKQGIRLYNAYPPKSLNEEITFQYNEMIYVDREFISNLTGGTKGSIGLFGGVINFARSPENLAIDKLKKGIIEKISNFIFTSVFGEATVSGYLVMPEEETIIEIEGKECILALCCENSKFNSNDRYMPVLMKKDSISYPSNLLKKIRSKLVFYGQVKQIPIATKEIKSDAIFMARVVGYLNTTN
ncbi:hypothetical protein DSECCO2_617340 [anaerobic digester metagenome]